MMDRHEDIEQILATYRDASGAERAEVDAHLKACSSCAERYAAYGEADALLAGVAQPALPPRLSKPFAALLSAAPASSPERPVLAFARGLAPVAVVLFLLVGLSAILWSVRTERAPVTATPTLTSTFTPTSVAARDAAAAGLAAAARGAAQAHEPAPVFVPTPAPAPGPVSRNSAILFVASGAHATISH